MSLSEPSLEELFDEILEELREEQENGSPSSCDYVSLNEAAVADAVRRINELFADAPEDATAQFDEALYEQLKPHFIVLLEDFETRVHLVNDLTH